MRAVMPLGTLLGEMEEFCSTSLKTLLLLLKHRNPRVLPLTSPSSPNAAAGAALAGQREQLSPVPPAGKKWLSPVPGRATV